ncbi:MAG TPA: sigma-70 family RNA polymerase sigma factor [Actinomycetota bacterium]|nr:sigma-70 family RNA polymerase sigma factor [Actinomycetota bacterium]
MAVAARILNIAKLPDLRSDKSLVRAAQAGEKEAVTQLVGKYYPRVYSFLSYATNSNTAEDLTQEVFTRALGALGRFNGRYQFEPWLLRIAKNLVIDESRKDVHRPSATDPTDLTDLEPISEDVDRTWDSVNSKLAGGVVRSALERLPLRQRTALVLREIEGLSYAEIADVIGTNVRGAEATLRRARARFRLEAADVESTEGLQAVCKRTLRLVASEGRASVETGKHLRTCRECRARATKIGGADRMLGALPPLALAQPAWLNDLVASMPMKVLPRPRGILEMIRSAPYEGMASPLAHGLQAVASVAVAGMVALASVTNPPLPLSASGSVEVPPASVESVEPVDSSAAAASPISVPLTPDTALQPVTLPGDRAATPAQSKASSEEQVTNKTGPLYAVNRVTDKVGSALPEIVEVPPVLNNLENAITDATQNVQLPEVLRPEVTNNVLETPSVGDVAGGVLPEGPSSAVQVPSVPVSALPRRRLLFS